MTHGGVANAAQLPPGVSLEKRDFVAQMVEKKDADLINSIAFADDVIQMEAGDAPLIRRDAPLPSTEVDKKVKNIVTALKNTFAKRSVNTINGQLSPVKVGDAHVCVVGCKQACAHAKQQSLSCDISGGDTAISSVQRSRDGDADTSFDNASTVPCTDVGSKDVVTALEAADNAHAQTANRLDSGRLTPYTPSSSGSPKPPTSRRSTPKLPMSLPEEELPEGVCVYVQILGTRSCTYVYIVFYV